MNKLTIIIPVYNEAATIDLILNKINDVVLPKNIQKEIIVINDCSSDKTKEAIEAGEKAVQVGKAATPVVNTADFEKTLNGWKTKK